MTWAFDVETSVFRTTDVEFEQRPIAPRSWTRTDYRQVRRDSASISRSAYRRDSVRAPRRRPLVVIGKRQGRADHQTRSTREEEPLAEWDKIKVRDLQRFAVVVEAGSFTGAAHALDETAKQVSRRISGLEDHLGTRLFHRTTRSMRPTADGEAWYAEVRQVLDRLDEATTSLSPSQRLSGLVRLQVPTLLSDTVQAWCGEQLARHPELSFVLLVGDRSDNLLARGVDLCVSGIPPTGSTLLVRKLGSIQSQMMAHVDYLDRRGRPEQPSDLIHHDCLQFAGPDVQDHWVLHRRDGLAQTVPIGGRMACNDSRILYRCLFDGFGIGPAPMRLGDAPEQRLLERVLPEWSFEAFPIFLVLAPGRNRHPSVRYVADALARICQDIIEDPVTRNAVK